MHELSIVLSIVDAAREQALQHQASGIERIGLEIGTLAGIEPDALEFAWDAAVPNTLLEKAERHIDYIQARAKCMGCGHEFDVQQLFEPCPRCGEYFNELIQGKELRIRSLTLITGEATVESQKAQTDAYGIK